MLLRNRNKLFGLSKQLYRHQTLNHVRYKSKYQMTVDLPDTFEVKSRLDRISENHGEESKAKIMDFGLGTLGGVGGVAATALFLGIPLGPAGVAMLLNGTVAANGLCGFLGTYGVSSLVNKFRLRNKTVENEEIKHELIQMAEQHHKEKLPRNHYIRNDVKLLEGK